MDALLQMTKPEQQAKEILEELGFTVKLFDESESNDCIYMQMPFASYHIDFAYPKKKIAIEVDGNYWHGTQTPNLTANQLKTKIKDAAKEAALAQSGWRVFRIPASTLERHNIALRRFRAYFTEEPDRI